MKLIKVRCKDAVSNLFEIAPKEEWQKALKGWKKIEVGKNRFNGTDGGVKVKLDGRAYEARAQIYWLGGDHEIYADIHVQPFNNYDGQDEFYKKILPLLPAGYERSVWTIQKQKKIPLTNPKDLAKISKQWLQDWKEFEKAIKALVGKF